MEDGEAGRRESYSILISRCFNTLIYIYNMIYLIMFNRFSKSNIYFVIPFLLQGRTVPAASTSLASSSQHQTVRRTVSAASRHCQPVNVRVVLTQ